MFPWWSGVLLFSAWFWYSDGVDRGLDLKGGASLTYFVDTSALPAAARDSALQNTVRVIEERINAIGLKDVKVDSLPPDRFEVQFPGKESAEVNRIKSILVKLGQLEFRMVATGPEGRGGREETERRRKDEMGEAYPGAPLGYRWVPMRPERAADGTFFPARPDRLVEIPEQRQQQEVDRLLKDRATLEVQRAEVESDPDKRAEVDASLLEIDQQLARAQEDLRGPLGLLQALRGCAHDGPYLDILIDIHQHHQMANWIS